jgi:hypothetical protein
MEELAAAGYRAVRFNPYLWPEGQAMTNEARRIGGGVVGLGHSGMVGFRVLCYICAAVAVVVDQALMLADCSITFITSHQQQHHHGRLQQAHLLPVLLPLLYCPHI